MPGSLAKILDKIKEAKTPERFTQDFLATKMGFKGGNYRQFIPLAKKLSLLNSDGTPTDLYKSFRNPTSSKAALAQAAKNGFREVFDRNEYAGSLSKDDFKGLVVEVTGLEPKDRVVQLICQTFEALKAQADFDKPLVAAEEAQEREIPEISRNNIPPPTNESVDFRLSYIINLVLPKTDDPAVFNAIFRSLRENLLNK
jgi:hypothetical protein